MQKQKKLTKSQIINYALFNIEHLDALLTLAKKKDSYLIEHAQESRKFYKEFKSICLNL